jgi:ubiquinone/menaquinone biosynthesis C-methylase UbiE
MAQKTSTVTHWDKYWEKGNLEYVNKIVEELEKTGPLKNKKILEIGAGSGATSIKLAQEGATVFCLDYSPKAINVIKQNGLSTKTRVHCVLADANELPFQQNSIDVCFHQGFLEHFTDVAKMLGEQYRVLRVQGIICADVPQRYSFYSLKKHVLIWLGKWFAGWETEFTLGGLRHLLEKHGFRYQWGYGRFHVRNIDRIQKRFLGRTILPPWIEKAYYWIIRRIENTFFGTHTAFSIGVVAKKQ